MICGVVGVVNKVSDGEYKKEPLTGVNGLCFVGVLCLLLFED